jgi:hypothetical protein
MPAHQITLIPAMQGLLVALQAACDALHAAPDEIDAVSVAGRLRPEATALPLLARAESLGRQFGFDVLMRLSAGAYEIRFTRTPGELP